MFNTELEKVSYGFGVNIAQNMKQQGMKVLDADALAQGIKDFLEGNRLAIPAEEIQILLQEFFKKLQEEQFAKNIEEGTVFLKDGKVFWKCRNCGYIYESEKALELCPACQHPKAYMQQKEENY